MANIKTTLASHGKANALRKYHPIFFTLVPMIVEHPLVWSELRQHLYLQVVKTKWGHILNELWPKLQARIGSHHVSLWQFDHYGNYCAHSLKCSTFERQKTSSVCRCALGKDADWIPVFPFILNQSLSFLNLFDHVVTSSLVYVLATFGPLNEDAL